jgi:hypothetical protein
MTFIDKVKHFTQKQGKRDHPPVCVSEKGTAIMPSLFINI